MIFSRLSEYFEKIEATSLRNEKTVILAEILKDASLEEVDKLVYLALGGLRPAFDRLEFQMADKMILRALGTTEKEYMEVGDLGELAANIQTQKFRSSPKVTQRRELGVSEVYEKLEKIAKENGIGSQERKVAGLAKLVSEMSPESAKYIVRMVAGKLRLGFSDKTVIDGLSYLESGDKKYSEKLEQAYQRRPDAGILGQMVKEMGVEKAIQKIDVTMGTPIVPALAQRLKTSAEMIDKMGKVIVEKKFDGTRVQIHFSRKKQNEMEVQEQASMFEDEKPNFFVRTFTRNLDESSAMFPELQQISEQIKADEVILDSEAVGYDPKTNKLVPFQLTITRKRKHGISEAEQSVPLRFFVFDIMYRDGESLIDLPLWQRREILREVVQGDKGSELGTRKFGTRAAREQDVLVVDDFIVTDDPKVLREYHAKQLAAGLEGALVKQIDGKYMPGRTGFNWVKFKEAEDSRAKLADTIDCVIMGYYFGKGKRSGFGLGAFLVGIKNGDKIVTLAKVGTGISDEQFGELKERLGEIMIKKNEDRGSELGARKFGTEGEEHESQGSELGARKLGTRGEVPSEYSVPKILTPDVWVEPKIVVEVAADEITVSPTHSAGYALRFPRLVKFRDDKAVEQITTLVEVKGMI